jgi:hypothetical protein
MATFRVHVPTGGAPDSAGDAERASFLREGFCWPALLFGPLWLLARGLWRPFALWCIAAIILAVAISSGRLPGSVAGWLYFVGALFLGLEGRNFVAAALERRGFRLVDIVARVDRATAEKIFFSRWLANPPVVPIAAARPVAPVSEAHVIGLFPEAGG